VGADVPTCCCCLLFTYLIWQFNGQQSISIRNSVPHKSKTLQITRLSIETPPTHLPCTWVHWELSAVFYSLIKTKKSYFLLAQNGECNQLIKQSKYIKKLEICKNNFIFKCGKRIFKKLFNVYATFITISY